MRTDIIVVGGIVVGREREGTEAYIQVLFTAERDVDRTNSEPVLLIGHESPAVRSQKARSPSPPN